jgi:putative transcriptional regulator
MSSRQRSPSVFEQIKAGLEDSIAYSRGTLSLVTTEPPSPPPELSRNQIAALRRRLRMSQAYFAAVLNVSPKAVQSWEHGLRRPSDAALRMLQVIGQQPSVVRAIAGAGTIRAGRSARIPRGRPGVREGEWNRKERKERRERLPEFS